MFIKYFKKLIMHLGAITLTLIFSGLFLFLEPAHAMTPGEWQQIHTLMSKLHNFQIWIDHRDIDPRKLTQAGVDNARNLLHIAYGHSTYGSQIITGLTGLNTFANSSNSILHSLFAPNSFAWNNGGADGALDIRDYFVTGDLGDPVFAWEQNTKTFLDNPANADINVVIWAWEDGAGTDYGSTYPYDDPYTYYIDAMNRLQIAYPYVYFVFMTSHVDGGSTTSRVYQYNARIREYCVPNSLIFYDFADIESWDPDGKYYGAKLVNANCDYDSDNNGTRDKNWATAWQNKYPEGVAWFDCAPAHTQPLNANLKAYAMWALFAKLASRIDTTYSHTIVASAGPGGTISPSGNVVVPENCEPYWSFTITPNAGYQVSDVLVDGVSVGAVSTYTFTTLWFDGHTIRALFAANQQPLANSKTVSIYTNTPRSITLSGTDPEGKSLTYEIAAAPGHGTVTFVGNNSVTYVPAKGYTGADAFTYRSIDDNGTKSAVATVDITVEDPPADAWLPPIGIPEPSFGIRETYRMYDTPANRNPALTYTQNAEGGYYTHYIDNSQAGATDTDNPYGTAASPRLTIPVELPAGSVIEVHGTDYTCGDGSADGTGLETVSISVSGTIAQPVFIRGTNPAAKPKLTLGTSTLNIGLTAHYAIIENLAFVKNADEPDYYVAIVFDAQNIDHISIRNCESFSPESSLVYALNYTDPVALEDVVFFSNDIHPDNMIEAGDPLETRNAGLAIQDKTNRVWIVDNDIHDLSGDCITNFILKLDYPAQNYYIGRNTLHDSNKNAIDLVNTNNVVISQNFIYGFDGGSSWDIGDGTAVVIRRGDAQSPQNAWLIFNEIYNAKSTGIQVGAEQTSDVYLVGNIIHDIQGSGSAAGYRSADSKKVYMVNNIFYNVDNGIISHIPAAGGQLFLYNNIISDVAAEGFHVSMQGQSHLAGSEIGYNIFNQPADTVRIGWGGTTYDLADFQAVTGKGEGCLEQDPLFVAAASNNFQLKENSPAIDTGVQCSVYQTFEDSFGIDIRVDYAGIARPQGTGWDIGAYEHAGPGVAPISISPDALPDATETEEYSFTLTAAGGTSPYSWSIVSGRLARGLNIGASNGIISGTPSETGTMTFTARATDSEHPANRGEKQYTLAVNGAAENTAPTASFTATPGTGAVPLQVSFNAGASSDTDGSIIGYNWDFGDGATGDGVTTTHTYNTAGTYTATLTVTDDDSAHGTFEREITAEPVISPPDLTPPALFKHMPSDSAIQVPLDANIKLYLRDPSGIDQSSIHLRVNGQEIPATSNRIDLHQRESAFRVAGNAVSLQILYDPVDNFDYEENVTVSVSCSDNKGNAMSESFSFTTEMLLLGEKTDLSDSPLINNSVAIKPGTKTVFIAYEQANTGKGAQIGLIRSESADGKDVFTKPITITTDIDRYDNQKPCLSVDPVSGALYLAYARVDRLTGAQTVPVLLSQDSGSSFSELYSIPVQGADPVQFIRLNTNNSIAKVLIACQGTLYFLDSRNINRKITVAQDGVEDAQIKCDNQAVSHVMYEKGGFIYYTTLADRGVSLSDLIQVAQGSAASFEISGDGNTIYLAFEEENNVYFVKSTNGGSAFSAPVAISDDTGNHAQTVPFLALDRVNNRIFVTFEDNRFGTPDVYLTYSNDAGGSFKTDVVVNTDSAVARRRNDALIYFDKRLYIFFKDENGKVYLAKNTYIDSLGEVIKEENSDAVIKEDRVDVQVPDNSLDTSMILSVGKVNDPPAFENAAGAKLVGKVYDFGPGGTEFDQPITVRIYFTENDLINAGLSSTADITIYTYNLQTMLWEKIPQTTVYANYAEGQVNHFSFFGLGGLLGMAAAGGAGGGGGSGGQCFIATASYGTPMAGEVRALCRFRDKYLVTSRLGAGFVRFYYRHSPPVADYIRNKKWLKLAIRILLKPLVKIAELVA